MGHGFQKLFTDRTLSNLFPDNRSDHFFDALYGDAREGAYDIELKFAGSSEKKLNFEFYLNQRPGKCLACNLTYGLPLVFSKHPVIDINGLVDAISRLLGESTSCGEWQIGRTTEQSRSLHIIPLAIDLISR